MTQVARVPLYDAFSANYDRFVDWQARLAYEMPFLERLLSQDGVCRVLDTACGTGHHAVALARRGWEAVGADLSAEMIALARQNGARAGVAVPFVVAGFGQLADRVGGSFDALLCLGNSLPHVLTSQELRATLADFAAVLRPGGLLFIQNRNFDAVMADRVRWMSPQARWEGDREWLFLRFYDFNPDGRLAFNVVTLQRDAGGGWNQQVETTRLRPWLYAELRDMVAAAGFGALTCYGDMIGVPFDPETSGNLIVTALKERMR
jgi:SAM-dependent methyltransferase